MPFNSEQLAYAGNAAINWFLKNDPIDQYNVDRPLIKKLTEGKSEYGGGLQYVVEQLRYQNDSNFQSYFGDSQVTYNRKRTLAQAKFTWGSFHDGFGLNEDELTQNGIVMTDDRSASPSDAEKVQLTNLLKENMETLKLGFAENFDIMLHRSGSQSATDIAGLDSMISTTPTVGVVGGIDSSVAANAYWVNGVSLAVSIANLLKVMEQQWRACVRVGGKAPDFILAGDLFIDTYRAASVGASGAITRQIILDGGNKKGITVDAGVGNGDNTGLYYKGVPITWDPVFVTMDTLDAPATTWSSRCYFMNSKSIKLRPIKGHWMIPRRPPRVYDRYVHYWALTAKAALSTNKRNSNAVISVTGS